MTNFIKFFMKFICVVLCVALLTSCQQTASVNPSTTQTPTSTTKPTEQLGETAKPMEESQVSFVSGTTFSGQKRPALVMDKQYLEEASMDRKKAGRVVYSVNDRGAGYIEGDTVQQSGKETSEVTAVANLGYRFVKWSDGVTEPTRAGDIEEGVYTAIFDYAVLSMPIVAINTDSGDPITSKTEYVTGSISVLGCEQQYELHNKDMEIRGRGNNSWTAYPKKSYKIKLAEKENLFGLGAGKERVWVLLANHCDQSLLRNHMALELSRYFQGIAWGPASTSVEVYFNGEYAGVYLLAEEIKVSSDRVDIQDTNADAVDTGYLVELSNYAEGDIFQVARRNYQIHSTLSKNGATKRKQINYIKQYIQQCHDALEDGDEVKFRELVDVDSFLAAYMVEEIVKNLDSQWDSFYLYKDAGGKLCFGPVWDFDLSLGNANEGAEFYEGIFVGNGQGSKNGTDAWFTLAMQQTWFRQLVAEKWKEVYDSIAQMPQFILDEGKLGLASYKRNFKRWDIFGTVQNREPEAIAALQTYKAHYEYLAQWTANRIAWLDETFRNGAFVSNGEGIW